jgi:hypothetical protein
MDNRFTDIIQIIKQSRSNAIKAVNAELINLYWNIGEFISKKIEISEWGDAVVKELANYIHQNLPDIKGFSDKNINSYMRWLGILGMVSCQKLN